MRTASELATQGPNRPKKAYPLRAVREKFGIDQQVVAMEIGLNRTTLSNIEGGYQAPNLKTAYRLAKFFECDVYDLFPEDMVIGDE